MTGWVLAIDFGTTNTVAAVADARGARVLTVNGKAEVVVQSASAYQRLIETLEKLKRLREEHS